VHQRTTHRGLVHGQKVVPLAQQLEHWGFEDDNGPRFDNTPACTQTPQSSRVFALLYLRRLMARNNSVTCPSCRMTTWLSTAATSLGRQSAAARSTAAKLCAQGRLSSFSTA
jgi:hypothetical protein